MKNFILAILFLLSISIVNMTFAQEEIPSSVYTALDHLNQYLLIPIDLEEGGVMWDWAVVTVNDYGDNCRERDDTSAFLPNIAYDIHFYRLDESYHYRVSLDEQLVVPCVPLVEVPDDTLPALVDALDDLNRRVHLNLTLNDLPWTWRETQFDDYTLSCSNLIPPQATFDQHIDDYIIEFTLLGEQWHYRVSSDRLIVMLCNADEE